MSSDETAIPTLQRHHPDDELVWPQTVLLHELTALVEDASLLSSTSRARRWERSIARLLGAAFRGKRLMRAFESYEGLDASDPFRTAPPRRMSSSDRRRLYDSIPSHKLAWAEALAEVLGREELLRHGSRPHWSTRNSSAHSPSASLQDTLEAFVVKVNTLDNTYGLWAHAFGVGCPDGYSDPPVPAHRILEEKLDRGLPNDVWPLKSGIHDWDIDDFYDMVEALHDLASWPRTWEDHDSSGCVGHPGDESVACGQELYQEVINGVLNKSALPARLATGGEDRGRMVISTPSGLDDVVSEVLASPPVGEQATIAHAVALFRSRHREPEGLQTALFILARVVEAGKPLLRRELQTKDESDLFNIANNYDIRHHGAGQKGDLSPAYREWIFYWYLSTVRLIATLEKGQRDLQ